MGISFWQIAIIVLIVVLLFGAGKIPRLAKDLGAGINQFKRGLKEESKSDEGDEETETAKLERTSEAEAKPTATSAAPASSETKEDKKVANG
jgi:sec-independent protein translocase protein TatA